MIEHGSKIDEVSKKVNLYCAQCQWESPAESVAQ